MVRCGRDGDHNHLGWAYRSPAPLFSCCIYALLVHRGRETGVIRPHRTPSFSTQRRFRAS
jgi:hypothetical protein